MHFHLVVQDVDGDIGGMEIVVGEIFLDEIALVSEAHDEVVDAVVGIDLHDVPEDGAAADLHHRLGSNGGLFTEPGTQAPGKNNELHTHLRSGIGLPCLHHAQELLPPRSERVETKSAYGQSSWRPP